MDNKTKINNADSVGLYARTNSANIKRTYIQGMKPREEVKDEATGAPVAEQRAVQVLLQNRPIAGLLYSVSKDVCGEIFPVYAGRNIIGSSPEADIYLNEETVSPNHAILLIRNIVGNDGKRNITMNITDYDSDFGTAVNGRALGFDKMDLAGNEIIQIGCSYYFVFIPLDMQPYGLGQVSGFRATPRVEQFAPKHVVGSDDIYMPVPNEPIYPSVVGEEDEKTFYGRTVAKKEDHSSKKTIDN